MTNRQKIIKYLAIGLAVLLIIGIFCGVISLVGRLVGGGVYDEIKSYDVSGSVTRLDVEVEAADFEIIESDKFLVESNLKNIKVKISGGTLKITERSFTNRYKNPILKVYVPAGTVFDVAEISTGAGLFTADRLSAKELQLEHGAGEVVIGKLAVTDECEIDGGAGRLSVLGGSIRDLEFNIGVGEINFTSKVDGEAEINCGVGEANITLLGTREDYRIRFTGGIGDAELDGESVKGGEVYGDGAVKVEINCGIGSVNVEIKE